MCSEVAGGVGFQGGEAGGGQGCSGSAVDSSAGMGRRSRDITVCLEKGEAIPGRRRRGCRKLARYPSVGRCETPNPRLGDDTGSPDQTMSESGKTRQVMRVVPRQTCVGFPRQTNTAQYGCCAYHNATPASIPRRVDATPHTASRQPAPVCTLPNANGSCWVKVVLVPGRTRNLPACIPYRLPWELGTRFELVVSYSCAPRRTSSRGSGPLPRS